MTPLVRPLLVFLALAWTHPLPAQGPARQVLRLVPDDYGIVLVAHDLRAQFPRWEKSPLVKKLLASPLTQGLLESEEIKDLFKLQADLEKHLGIEWPTLRDEVLGDAAVFAFRPGPADKPDPEDFLIMVQARDARVMGNLLDRVNTLQKKTGELKELVEQAHRGVPYFRRVHDRSTQYYFIREGLFVLAGQEATLKRVIEQSPAEKASNLWQRYFERGAAPRSFLTLLVNPRVFDQEFKTKEAKEARGAEAFFKDRLAKFWDTLDGIVVNCSWEEGIDVRLALLGRERDPGPLAKELFAPARANPLWLHFPQKAIFTLTGQLDFSLPGDSWDGFLPPEARKLYQDILHRGLSAVIGIDLKKDLLPNIGPDWGLCILPGKDEKHVPMAVLAIAARPGPKGVQADQALYKGLNLLALGAVVGYNLKHPDTIRIQTVHQDKVEVKVLSNDKTFPTGFQPCFALKEGYFLLATSPEAIRRFQKDASRELSPDENLFARLSAPDLAEDLRRRRDFLTGHFAKTSGLDPADAKQLLDVVFMTLDLFDRVELAHTSGREQMNLILRIR